MRRLRCRYHADATALPLIFSFAITLFRHIRHYADIDFSPLPLLFRYHAAAMLLFLGFSLLPVSLFRCHRYNGEYMKNNNITPRRFRLFFACRY